MKRNVLSMVLLALAIMVSAQAKVEIGLKGGVNLASLSSDNEDLESNVTAYHGGAYGLIKVAKFGIQPEALFSKRGGDDIDMNYLDVPVIFKLYLAGGINLQAGPQFGILLNAEDDQGEDVKDFISNSDLSAAVGAGWDLPMGLNITARYIIGIKDVNEFPGSSDDIKNNTFQLSLGYSLFKVGN